MVMEKGVVEGLVAGSKDSSGGGKADSGEGTQGGWPWFLRGLCLGSTGPLSCPPLSMPRGLAGPTFLPVSV